MAVVNKTSVSVGTLYESEAILQMLILHAFFSNLYSNSMSNSRKTRLTLNSGISISFFFKFRLLNYFHNILRSQFPNFFIEWFQFPKSYENAFILIPCIYTSSSLSERSFIVRAARYWNAVPSTLESFDNSVHTFARNLIPFPHTYRFLLVLLLTGHYYYSQRGAKWLYCPSNPSVELHMYLRYHLSST